MSSLLAIRYVGTVCVSVVCLSEDRSLVCSHVIMVSRAVLSRQKSNENMDVTVKI